MANLDISNFIPSDTGITVTDTYTNIYNTPALDSTNNIEYITAESSYSAGNWVVVWKRELMNDDD